MTKEEIAHLDKASEILGLMELVRLTIGEICFDKDPEIFRQRVRKFEEAAVNSINSRKTFPQLSPEANEYVQGASSNFVTKIVSSIRHPADQ